MKYLFLSLILLLCVSNASAQSLLDVYKKGTVKLIPDDTYAASNNWNKVFATYYDTLYNTPMGDRKTLIMTPDGSAVVNHAYRNFYSKFSSDGQFIEEFGITNSAGSRFKKTQSIAGVVNNNTFYTGLDNMGNMYCFDFDGNYKKTLKLDYMTRQMIPLPNGKIAVVGWVIWAEKFRDFVAIVDYETNEEKVIWEFFTDRKTHEAKGGNTKQQFHYSFTFEKQGAVSCSTMPFLTALGIKARPQLACINNKLIVANPTNGELQTFDLDGHLISKKKMDLLSNEISIDEQKAIQKKAINRYESMDPLRFTTFNWVSKEESQKAHRFFIDAMKKDLNNINQPIEKPFFSTMIKDSDDNLLFFEFPDQKGGNKFNVWVYKNGGEFMCQSSFVCDEYDLQINPGKMVYHNGYIYGLQLLKDTDGVPLRLTRFKLTNP